MAYVLASSSGLPVTLWVPRGTPFSYRCPMGPATWEWTATDLPAGISWKNQIEGNAAGRVGWHIITGSLPVTRGVQKADEKPVIVVVDTSDKDRQPHIIRIEELSDAVRNLSLNLCIDDRAHTVALIRCPGRGGSTDAAAAYRPPTLMTDVGITFEIQVTSSGRPAIRLEGDAAKFCTDVKQNRFAACFSTSGTFQLLITAAGTSGPAMTGTLDVHVFPCGHTIDEIRTTIASMRWPDDDRYQGDLRTWPQSSVRLESEDFLRQHFQAHRHQDWTSRGCPKKVTDLLPRLWRVSRDRSGPHGLPRRLRLAAFVCGLGPEYIGEHLHVKRKTVDAWWGPESKTTSVDKGKLDKLAELLLVEPDWIMQGEPELDPLWLRPYRQVAKDLMTLRAWGIRAGMAVPIWTPTPPGPNDPDKLQPLQPVGHRDPTWEHAYPPFTSPMAWVEEFLSLLSHYLIKLNPKTAEQWLVEYGRMLESLPYLAVYWESFLMAELRSIDDP